jgi:signal transduction histidine kinase
MVLESAPVDLRAVVESTVEMVAAEANKKGLALAYLLDEPLLSRRVLGDAIRIRQARLPARPRAPGGPAAGRLIQAT